MSNKIQRNLNNPILIVPCPPKSDPPPLTSNFQISYTDKLPSFYKQLRILWVNFYNHRWVNLS